MGDVPVELVPEPVVGAPGNHRVGKQCRPTGEAWSHEVQELVALGGSDVLLEEELQTVSRGLQHPERPNPVRTVAQLDAGRDLAFSESQIGKRGEQEHDEDTALDEQYPPEIVRPDHATASAVNSARPPLPA